MATSNDKGASPQRHIRPMGQPADLPANERVLGQSTAASSTSRQSASAQSGKIRSYITFGALAAIIGTALAFATWPSTSTDFFGDTINHGSALGVFAGGVLALSGEIMLAIGIIAAGVRLGTDR